MFILTIKAIKQIREGKVIIVVISETETTVIQSLLDPQSFQFLQSGIVALLAHRQYQYLSS